MKRSRAAAVIAASLASPPLAASAQSGAPYKIGVTWPQTGPLAPVSVDYLRGAQFAVADVNAAGGINGHPLQLLVEDSAGTPQGGIAGMRKLAEVNGVQAMLTIFTNVVTAQIPLADQLKLPTLSTVESPGLFDHSQFSFSHAPTWGTTVPMMAAYWKAHGMTRVYGLLTNSAIGVLQSAKIRSEVQAIGGEYGEALLDPDATDFRGPVERVRDFNAQVVVITGQGANSDAVVVKQLREMGLGVQIFSLGQSYTSKVWHDAVGPYAEGMILGGLYLDPNVSNAFARRYRAQVGYIPAYIAGEWYDVVKIHAYAIAHAGYNGVAIRDAIANLRGLPSVLGGTIAMAADHYTRFSTAGLWQVKAGKLVKVDVPRA